MDKCQIRLNFSELYKIISLCETIYFCADIRGNLPERINRDKFLYQTTRATSFITWQDARNIIRTL